MLLRPIGANQARLLHGVMLTPQEYQAHEAYHPMAMISSDTLFITYDPREGQCDRPNWNAILPARATGFAILEASVEEERRLVAAGYQMLNLGN